MKTSTCACLGIAALLLASSSAQAQTLQQTAGIYYAYPAPESASSTPAPKGYEPFYISHYGRHGSRWVTDDYRYTGLLAYFDCDSALTPLGLDVKARLEAITDDAIGRSGSLSPIGERQHRGIAERMMQSFPEVFADSARIDAASSTKVRCVMSMAAFTERLKELNPSLQVARRANERDMRQIAYVSPEAQAFSSDTAEWRKDYWAYVAEMVSPDRLVSSLFANPGDMDYQDKFKIATMLYWIASDMQDVDLGVDLYDIFEYDELQRMWRCINARMYVCNGPSPLAGGVMAHCADYLLADIVDTADQAVAGQGPAASLRFGHDTALLRLLTIMGVEGCVDEEQDMAKIWQAWQDYSLTPMAANLQIIFYRNADNDVVAKLLLNEREVSLPLLDAQLGAKTVYYPWPRLRPYLLDRI